MVDSQPPNLEWKGYLTTSTGLDNSVQCLSARLGGSVQWNQDRGALVYRREASPYQQLGPSGRHLRNSDFYQRDEQCSGPSPDGQSVCSGLCQQDGREPLTYLSPPGLQLVVLVSPKKHHLSPSRQGEFFGRPRVEGAGVISQVDVAQRSLPPDPTGAGPEQNRPVCNQAEPSVAILHQLEARSICSRDGCTPPSLDEAGRVCISSLLLDREMSTETSHGGEQDLQNLDIQLPGMCH